MKLKKYISKTMLLSIIICTMGFDYTSVEAEDTFVVEDGCLVEYRGNEKNVTIPNGVVTIGKKAFLDSDIEEVIMPDSVETIQYKAFSNCRNLKSIVFSNNLKSITMAFGNCDSLEKVVFPETLNKLSGFYGCDSLKEIVLNRNDNAIYDGVFSDCPKLTTIYAHDTNKLAIYLRRKYKINKVSFDRNKIGDTDGNGVVDIEDVLVALKSSLGIVDLEDEAIKAIDFTNDGNVSLDDVLFVLKGALGIITTDELEEKLENAITVNGGFSIRYEDFPEEID